MTLVFRYKIFQPPGGNERKRPMIPVTFINGDESVETLALLDSGADFVALSKEMAEVLGLDLSGPQANCTTPSGAAQTTETKVTIKIGRNHESYALVVPVKVLLLDSSGTPPLLGRIGFFDEFEITFNQRSEKIYLKRLDKADRKTDRKKG
jgi:predicted aspartyl protease